MRYIEDSSTPYCVTEGSIFFCVVLLFYASDAFVSENLTSKRCSTRATCILMACSEIFHLEFEEFVLRSLNVLGNANRKVSIGL